MASQHRPCRLWAAVAAGLATVVAVALPARADVISTTPTLPLLGVAYVPSTGAGCFPTRNVCISGGMLTLTSVVSSNFNLTSQDIVANATYTGELTTMTDNTPIGSVSLAGTVEQEIVDRTFSTEIGSWTTDIVSILLTGSAFGNILTLTDDGSNPSTGTTSITRLGGDPPLYQISSFFDVFVDLTLDDPIPLHTSRGPIEFVAAPQSATPAPEPATFAVLTLPLLLLSVVRGRRCRRNAPAQARAQMIASGYT